MSIKFLDTIYKKVDTSNSATKASQDGSGNVITSTYLKLSGGTITSSSYGPLIIERSGSSNMAAIKFKNDSGVLGSFGMNTVDGNIMKYNSDTSASWTILDSGNFSTWAAAKNHNHDSSYYNASTSRTANTVLAAPNGSAGAATFRKLVSADLPSHSHSTLTIFNQGYDGTAAKTITGATLIGTLSEGTSNLTDGTMVLTSYASDNGFADTNATNTIYKRKASCIWGYIKGKTDSLYSALGHTHSQYSTTDHTHKYAGSSSAGGSATTALSVLTGSMSGSTHKAAIQDYFTNNKSTVPRNKLISFYSSAYSNGSQYFGYYLSGYNDNPYGGFFVAHYGTPYYVGIMSGTFTESVIITSGNYTTYCAKASHTHDYAASNHNHDDRYYNAGTSRTANTVLAAPNGSAGAATFRSLVAADIPTLAISKISGLQTALDGKAATGHNHDSVYLKLTGGTIQNGTTTGPLNINTTSTTEVGMRFNMSGSNKSWVGYHPTYGSIFYNYASGKYAGLNDSGVLHVNGTAVSMSGHTHSNYVLDTGDTMTGALTISSGSNVSLLIKRTTTFPCIGFYGGTSPVIYGYYGFNGADNPALCTSDGNTVYSFLHSNNWSTYCAAASHNHSAANITSGTLAVARGGTGQTTLNAAMVSLIESLSTATATPTDDNYYIAQDTGGASSYHRRKHSAMYNYIKGKLDSVYSASGHSHTNYVLDTGDTMTGTLAINTSTMITTKYSSTAYNILVNHNNGNVSLSSASGGLYLGYTNTSAIYCRGTYVNIDSGNYTTYCSAKDHTHSNYYDYNVSRTANTVLAAPNGSAGSASFRKLVSADLPSHNHSADNITSGTLAVARGGTGKTTLQDACNALINALSTGSSAPVDADYYVAQYAGGGTSTTTYHRRPVSALYSYMKSKFDSVYAAAHSHNYLPLSNTAAVYVVNSQTGVVNFRSSQSDVGIRLYSGSSNDAGNNLGGLWGNKSKAEITLYNASSGSYLGVDTSGPFFRNSSGTRYTLMRLDSVSSSASYPIVGYDYNTDKTLKSYSTSAAKIDPYSGIIYAARVSISSYNTSIAILSADNTGTGNAISATTYGKCAGYFYANSGSTSPSGSSTLVTSTGLSGGYAFYCTGKAYISSTLTQNSDRTLKYDIQNLIENDVLLKKVDEIPVVSYRMKETDEKRYGFIAQDFLSDFPEVTSFNSDQNTYSLEYNSCFALKIAALERRIKMLEEKDKDVKIVV